MRRNVLLTAALALLSGCMATPTSPPSPRGSTGAAPTGLPAVGTISPVSPALLTLPPTTLAPGATGFAFDAADVAAYYQSLGYACDPPIPSRQARGYLVTSCSLLDADARTRVVGIVTDTSGRLGNGYAGVWGAAGEGYLDPAAALEPLAAFLGTMLGSDRGGDAAIWLKERLGARYDETTSGDIAIATYTGPDDDPSELYVEVADPAYLAAPTPSP